MWPFLAQATRSVVCFGVWYGTGHGRQLIARPWSGKISVSSLPSLVQVSIGTLWQVKTTPGRSHWRNPLRISNLQEHRHITTILRFRGSLGGLLGASWGPLGSLLGLFWGLFGASGGFLGACRGLWGACLGRRLEMSVQVPPLGSLLEPSWGSLGPSWGFLGPSWGSLGPSLSRLGGISGRLGAILGASWTAWDGVKAEEADMFKMCVVRKGMG